MPGIDLPRDRALLTDGGMGEQLAGIDLGEPGTLFWSGKALIDAPETVGQLHRDFIRAGADLIVTNTYGVVRSFMREVGIEERFEELNRAAAELACAARDAEGADVLIAGSLPPLSESYEPDEVRPEDVLADLYAEQAAILAPHVDLLIAETLTTVAETRAAARAAAATGKPVWVSWTMHEDRDGCLKGGATVAEAAASVADVAGRRLSRQLLHAGSDNPRVAGAHPHGPADRRICQHVPPDRSGAPGNQPSRRSRCRGLSRPCRGLDRGRRARDRRLLRHRTGAHRRNARPDRSCCMNRSSRLPTTALPVASGRRN